MTLEKKYIHILIGNVFDVYRSNTYDICISYI